MPSPSRRLLEVEKKSTIISSPFRSSYTAIIESTYIIDFHDSPDSSAPKLSPNQKAHAVEGDTTPTSFQLKSNHSPVIDHSSVIDFHALPEPDPDVLDFASESPNVSDDEYQKPDYQFCRLYLQEALYCLIDEKPESCQRRCMEFINTKLVPDALKVEALQLLATIVPLPKALQYLGTATNIIIPYKNADPQNLMWKGFFMTTRELLLKINNIVNEKFVHYDNDFYPLPGAGEKEMKKSEPGGKQVRILKENIKEIEAEKMRSYKRRLPSSTLKKPLRVRGAWERSYTEICLSALPKSKEGFTYGEKTQNWDI